jgi:hypothetical protein
MGRELKKRWLFFPDPFMGRELKKLWLVIRIANLDLHGSVLQPDLISI